MLPNRLVIDTIATKVKTHGKPDQQVTAVCRRLSSPNHYTIELRTKRPELFLGSLEFEIIPTPNTYTEGYKGKDKLSRLDVKYMRNQSTFQQVSKALFECLFRISILAGCEGRITLEAVRETHYFHYKNGFRPICRSSDAYYSRLAKALYDAGNDKMVEDLGARILYLPRATIKELITQYSIDHELSEFKSETSMDRKQIAAGEHALEYVKSDGPLIQIYRAITHGFNAKMEQLTRTYEPSFFTTIEEDESISLELMEEVYNAGFKLLFDLLPVDTTAKEAKVAVILSGMMKILSSYYDFVHASAQNKEEDTDVLLYDSSKTAEANIKSIGKKIINEHTLSIEESTMDSLFPGLKSIPEFASYNPCILQLMPATQQASRVV